MPRKIPEMNKKIAIISILFAIVLTGLVFAYEKSGRFFIEGAENKDISENGGLNSLGDRVKETNNAPKLVIADSFSANNADSDNNDSRLSKSVKTIAEIGERFLGLERKDILYFISKKLEYKPKIIKVPQDYKSIQLAIDNANPKDTIEVSCGEYKENIVMKECVSVIGAGADKTMLDGNGFGNVVTFRDNITDKTELSGFTVKNSGKNLSGILIGDSSPLIDSNIITDNEYNIYIKGDSFPIIRNNTITFANKGIQIYNFEKRENQGGSIQENEANGKNEEKELSSFSSLTKPVIIDNLIIDNKIGIDLYNSSALVEHNNISYNNHYKTHISPTSGVYLSKSSAEITSNIITDNGICELCGGINVDEKSKNVIISHNNIWNNKNDYICFGECILEENNISEDPVYVDAINGDYKLSEESPLVGKAKDGLDIGIRW